MIGRRDFRYLALEAVIVLFSIIAALFVDSAREEAACRAAAQAAVERLMLEVDLNLHELRAMRDDVTTRLRQIRALRDQPPADVGLAELIDRFQGYRTPDLAEATWERLSGSDLASVVDPDLLAEAFRLYEWNRQFDQIDREISRFVYSEVFYLPERLDTALAISERIKEQLLAWAAGRGCHLAVRVVPRRADKVGRQGGGTPSPRTGLKGGPDWSSSASGALHQRPERRRLGGVVVGVVPGYQRGKYAPLLVVSPDERLVHGVGRGAWRPGPLVAVRLPPLEGGGFCFLFFRIGWSPSPRQARFVHRTYCCWDQQVLS